MNIPTFPTDCPDHIDNNYEYDTLLVGPYSAAPGSRDNRICLGNDAEEYGELTPFIEVTRGDKDDANGDAVTAVFDPEIDVPLPRSHVEVVKARAAKSAVGRRRSELLYSQVGKRTTKETVMQYCL